MARRSVEIKKIQDRSKRQVTFTKRRQGLFKKAGQLHSMCDADVAVIAFSLAGNAYAFGDPSVSSILDRYRQAGAASPEDIYPVAVNLTAAEKKVGEILEKAAETKGAGGRSVWDKEVEKLGFGEIEEMENAVEEMKKLIGLQKRRILSNESNCGE
ncbi:MADS-box transcription factor 47-like [Heracleum sosnowskyi]|uniref:MADS-box transcription factor 47-like n=1 Tax=Heracleum sosnowskyi TaxID=360622 RepID=A0AAD8M939_9APIA|nr:MADS-box transcription factor 47-like [Heracleum sosnowskyi]